MDLLTLLQQMGNNMPKKKGQTTPFTSEQVRHATAIYNESIKQGVDPRVTLSIGWQESRLGANNLSPADSQGRRAVGSMQVRIPAATDVGMLDKFLKNKDSYEKTGKGDASLDATMGVAYVKMLGERYGAKNLGETAAAYFQGTSALSKKTGWNKEAQKYVQDVTGHMGRFFGNGEKASWKQPVAMVQSSMPRANSSSVLNALAPVSQQTTQETESIIGAQSESVPRPIIVQAQQQPVAAKPSETSNSSAYIPNLYGDALASGNEAQTQAVAQITNTPNRSMTENFLSSFDSGGSVYNTPPPRNDNLFDFITNFKPVTPNQNILADIQYQKDDPSDKVRGMVASIYDEMEQNG